MKSIILLLILSLLLVGTASAAVHYDTNHSAAWTSPFLTGGNSTLSINAGNATVAAKTMNINGRTLFPQVIYGVCSATNYSSNVNDCVDNIINSGNHTFSTDIGGYGDYKGKAFDPRTAYAIAKMGYTPQEFFHYLPSRDSNGINYSWAQVNSSYLAGFWGRYDEPVWDNTTQHTNMLNYYTEIKATAPNQLVYVNVWTRGDAYEDTADVVFWADYPYRTGAYGAIDNKAPRALIGYYNDKYWKSYNNLIQGYTNFDDTEKAFYPIIQSLGSPDDADVQPTSLLESRQLRYSAITYNVKGFAYWDYDTLGGLKHNNTALSMHRNLTDEINYLSDILILPTKDYDMDYHAGSNVTFSTTLSQVVDGTTMYNWNWMLKQSGDTHYLIILNKDNRSVSDVEITVSGLSGAMTARTLGLESAGSTPGIDYNVTDGTFTDSFNGLEAKVYEIAAFDETPPEEPPASSFSSYIIRGTGGNSTWANYIIEGLQ